MKLQDATGEEKFWTLREICVALEEIVQTTLVEFLDRVCRTHFYYMEIFRRLTLNPLIKMRIIRKYLIDYFVMIQCALREISVLTDGKLKRLFDVEKTPAMYIHPTINGSFNLEERLAEDAVKLSVRSVNGFRFLTDELLQEIPNLALPELHSELLINSIKGLEIRLNSVKLSFYNWEVDLIDMFDNVQQILQTKLCPGYDRFLDTDCNYVYSMIMIPPQPLKYRTYPTLHIPMEAVNFNVDNNAALIKFNINHGIIPDAFGCSVATVVMKSTRFQGEIDARIVNQMKKCAARSSERGHEVAQKRVKKSNGVWHAMYLKAVEIAENTICLEDNYWVDNDEASTA
jgi:hypothetical protein